jgi:divalent metal cation (Fe/Co/Zn/Cd) transporter
LPDPGQRQQLQAAVDQVSAETGLGAHRLRFRDTGRHIIMSVHLVFPDEISIGEAHRRATEFEQRLGQVAAIPVEVLTHLESASDHDLVHPGEPPF